MSNFSYLGLMPQNLTKSRTQTSFIQWRFPFRECRTYGINCSRWIECFTGFDATHFFLSNRNSLPPPEPSPAPLELDDIKRISSAWALVTKRPYANSVSGSTPIYPRGRMLLKRQAASRALAFGPSNKNLEKNPRVQGNKRQVLPSCPHEA